MEKVKVLVVEDEIIIADSICEALENEGYEALEPCSNYDQAVDSINNNRPDIGILDIQLSGKKTGVDVASFINKKAAFPFVFLTSNSDKLTLSEAKLVRPNSFLIKPFNIEELYASIEIALHNFSEEQNEIDRENFIIDDSIFVKVKKCFKRIKFDDIEFINSDNVYLDLHLRNGKKLTVRDSVSEFLLKLNNNFLRTHRSYIINLNYLESIDHLDVTINGTKIPISKTYREDFLSRVNKV